MPEPLRLRVVEVIRETADACSLVFDGPLPPYRPGQFLTLRVGGGAARCYSLASSPHTGDRPKVTVKRVPGGHGSNWICDEVAAGHELEVLPPAGVFTPTSLDGDFLLFAGGSGITPVMSIVKSVLAQGSGRLVLVYANRDEASVIFARELTELAAAHPDRLHVVHSLESVQGRPTAAQLTALAQPYASYEAFVCGPGAYMELVERALAEVGVPRGRVHIERFVSLSEDPFAAPGQIIATGDAGTVEVELDGETSRHDWPAEARLLDVLLAAGLKAPYSCRQGACSACACKVVAGEVKMLANDVLDERDLADGWVLACQAVPLTGHVQVTYTED